MAGSTYHSGNKVLVRKYIIYEKIFDLKFHVLIQKAKIGSLNLFQDFLGIILTNKCVIQSWLFRFLELWFPRNDHIFCANFFCKLLRIFCELLIYF